DEATRELQAAGGTATGVVADVTDPRAVATLIAAGVAHGGVDIVVNKVGGSGGRGVPGAREGGLRALPAPQPVPAPRVARAALPHLRARGGGVIVMIASIYGREAGGGPSYNVAKAGEISLAKAMARELAREKIRVLSVAPGSILFPGGGWDRRQTA